MPPSGDLVGSRVVSSNRRRRTVSQSKKRKASHITQDPFEETHWRLELDSHADTCAFNPSGCLVINDTGDAVTVEPFTAQLGDLTEVPICTVAVAYDDPHPQVIHTFYSFTSLW